MSTPSWVRVGLRAQASQFALFLRQFAQALAVVRAGRRRPGSTTTLPLAPSTISTSPSLIFCSTLAAPTTSGRCRLRARMALCDSVLPRGGDDGHHALRLQLREFRRRHVVADQDVAGHALAGRRCASAGARGCDR